MTFISYNSEFYTDTVPVISIYDRGFSLGDGVFETIKITNSKPELWDAHLKRMAFGCSVLGIDIPENLYDTACQLIQKNHLINGILKITLSRQSPLRGLGIHSNCKVNILMTTSDMPKIPETITAMVSDIRRNEGSVLSQIKSLNYGDNILALKQAHQLGYDDALMLNNQGQPCCFTTGNIVIETQSGVLLTPPSETGCLNGTFVQTLKNIQYRNFSLDEAAKIWRSNCISGLVEVELGY